MIRIVAQGVEQAKAEMARYEKQIPFATALGLTRTAEIAKRAIEDEMRSVFDRPTRWTLNSLRLFPARKDNLQARVWVKNETDKAVPATRWLNPQIGGGNRQEKKIEAALKARGILPAGKYVVPGKDARLNSFGNLSKGQLNKLLAGLGVQSAEASQGKPYFVLGRGDDAIGIAQRTGRRSIKIILAFVSRPRYSQRLDFYGVGERVAAENLGREVVKAMQQAMATAR